MLAYNVIGSIDGEQSRLFRSMHRTAASVWVRLRVFPIGIGADGVTSSNRNIIVLATDLPPGDVPSLTDAHAPTDALIDIN